LARPQWGALETGQTWMGEDVVFALDCSASMTAADILPSRLQRAKFSILDFVQRRNHGRVGLVGFAGSAFIQCPLTFDTGAFEETLLAMDEKTLPIPGTDIGRALGEAYQAMDKTSHHKLVILVTDGEDLEKSGIAEAKRLATNGVVVFTIGVGTTSGKEIQVLNATGQAEWLRDDKGEIVRSHLDEATLREIAQVTGGNYYPLGTLGEGLARIRPAVESQGGRQNAREAGVERFHLFIALLLILLVAESLISTRRREIPETA
jgi:Ca-activated chloride channel family protein